MTANMKPNGGFDWVRDHGCASNKYISTDNLLLSWAHYRVDGKTSYNHGSVDNNRHTDLKIDSLPIYLECRALLHRIHRQVPH